MKLTSYKEVAKKRWNCLVFFWIKHLCLSHMWKTVSESHDKSKKGAIIFLKIIDENDCETFVCSLVMSHLDYANAILKGLPDKAGLEILQTTEYVWKISIGYYKVECKFNHCKKVISVVRDKRKSWHENLVFDS